jgi:hypothetical protein
MLDAIHALINNQTTAPISIQFGGPSTLTFSSVNAQVIECSENGELDLVLLDAEILQGNK